MPAVKGMIPIRLRVPPIVVVNRRRCWFRESLGRLGRSSVWPRSSHRDDQNIGRNTKLARPASRGFRRNSSPTWRGDFGTAVGAGINIEVVYLGVQANSVVIDQTLGAADTDQAAIIRTNFNDIDTSLSIASTDNGVSAGPITISGSATVTVLGNWSVV